MKAINLITDLLSVLVCTEIALAAVTIVQADAITDEASLVGYWKLDETAGSGTVADSGPTTTHTGTVAGGVTLGQAAAMPLLGTSANFNGSNGKIDVPFSAALNPAAFTVEAWAKSDNTASYGSPVTSRQSSPANGYIFYEVSPGEGNDWEFWTGPGWHQFDGPAVVTNQWVHLAGTYGGSNKKFYMNGHPVASATGVTVNPNTLYPLRIGAGATEGAGGFFFNGNVDNVAVFNAALAHQSVADHYNSFSKYATEVLGDGPVGYWRLGEQSGNFAYNAANVTTHTGTHINGVVVRQITDTALAGDIDTANDYAGNTDIRTQVPYSAALNTASFTVEAWAKVEGGSGHRSVFTSRTTGGGAQGYMLYALPSDVWEFWTGDGVGNWDKLTGPSITTNQWYHLAATFDASTGAKKLYVNGAPVAGALNQQYAPQTASTNPLSIGSGGNGGADFEFNGKIDEVAYFNTVLGDAAIREHYRLGLDAEAPAQNLVANFDIGTSTIYAGPGPAGLSGPAFTQVNAQGSVFTSNGIGLNITGGTAFSSPNVGNSLAGDYIYDAGGGAEDTGFFTISGLNGNRTYDIFLIASDGTGWGAANQYGADYDINSEVRRALGGDVNTAAPTPDWVEGTQYVHFRGLQPTGGVISGSYTNFGQPHTGLAGVQVVENVPEPGSFVLLLLGVCGLLVFSRRRR